MQFAIPDWLMALVPSFFVFVVLVVALAAIRFFFERQPGGAQTKALYRQGLVLIVCLVGILAFVVFLPIADSTRGQLLSLIGLLITAAIALSSTTFIGNMMAGLLMRALRHFRVGDFIRCEGFFGRVTEMGLLHTEIQTEDRDLVTLPNLFMATHPLRVLRSSGTVVSAELSLGYDVPHGTAESALLEAAAAVGLNEPFVQILELGDYSVTYKVAGILTEVKQLMTKRSLLRASVLDHLHGAGVEILSPLYQSQRVLPSDLAIIPKTDGRAQVTINGGEIFPEERIFDKAEHAESLEKLRAARDSLALKIAEMEERLAAGSDDEESLKKRLARARSLEERLGRRIDDVRPD